jgi:hypothetical protein
MDTAAVGKAEGAILGRSDGGGLIVGRADGEAVGLIELDGAGVCVRISRAAKASVKMMFAA